MKWLNHLLGKKDIPSQQVKEKVTSIEEPQVSTSTVVVPGNESLPTETPMSITCCQCGVQYVPGIDAIIVTAGETHRALLESGIQGISGPGAELRTIEYSYRGELATFGIPDLVMFRTWSEIADDEKKRRCKIIRQILTIEEAFRRTWKCEKCKAEQYYRFPDAPPTRFLSEEQQKALFLKLSVLYKIASESIESNSNSPSLTSISAQVARWALPYAERIRHAEAFCRQDRDFDKALSEFLNLTRVLPTAAIVLMDIGVCFSEKMQDEKAKYWLKKALQYVPQEYERSVQQNLDRIS